MFEKMSVMIRKNTIRTYVINNHKHYEKIVYEISQTPKQHS